MNSLPIKRMTVIAVLAIAITLFFWMGSRYPDLNTKALMANSGSVQDTLTVWPILSIHESMPLAQKILFSTINWIHNNLKGMTFGVIIGGCAFAFLPLLQLKAGGGRWTNAFYGMLIGTPLGVCVNCAAPVFKGILQSKRLELAFAMMMSSPTLNIVVLTMVFSLFPWHLALIKVTFTLVMVLVLVPFLSWLLRNHSIVNDWSKLEAFTQNPSKSENACVLPNESWINAIKNGLMDSAKGVAHIGIRTIPLMLLAGFLGATLSQMIPFSLYTQQPDFLSLSLIVAVTTLLPVPVAFDVILANAMYAQGLSVAVVITLLCGLGIFSIYSFFIVWSSVSRLWACTLIFACYCVLFTVALIAPQLHRFFFVEPNLTEYQKQNALFESASTSVVDREVLSPFAPLEKQAARSYQFVKGHTSLQLLEKRLNIDYSEVLPEGELKFKKFEGFELGITRGFRYGIRDYTDPFWVGRGTGTGDLDKNGWPDLVLGSSHGPQVYLNQGGWFERVSLKNFKLQQFNTYVVAFIDLNNDSWLDLFFTTYEHGNFVIYSEQGHLKEETLTTIPNNQGLLTISPGFYDFDGNGYLDVLNGNMALGVITASHQLDGYRQNAITFIENKKFKEAPLSLTNVTGETMSTLIADINNDNQVDLYIGNDFIVPDRILLSSGGGFKEVLEQQLIGQTPTFSMSADVGDFNNDLRPDLLSMGTIMREPWVGQEPINKVKPEVYAKDRWTVETCKSIANPIHHDNCMVNRSHQHILDVKQHRNWKAINCNQLPTRLLQQQCLITTMWFLVTNNLEYFTCDEEFSFDEKLLKVCRILKSRGDRYEQQQLIGAIPQKNGNWLYKNTGDGLQAVSENTFRHPGGWTWNGKFIDIDNDGWQDIFNAESAIRENDYGWNVAMKNYQGTRFEPMQFSWNLTDNFGLFSFVAMDYDLDGDLDIIGNSAEGPIQVYQNPFSQQSYSVTVSLRDHLGNAFGVGAKIIVKAQELSQVRWIKASGGYQSFDGLDAHFGLGKQKAIESITVMWPDQSTSIINGPLEAGRHYLIERFNKKVQEL
ncbi:MAG: FG-GAP-like repeat-containing protein [Pseudomonadota bacterium]